MAKFTKRSQPTGQGEENEEVIAGGATGPLTPASGCVGANATDQDELDPFRLFPPEIVLLAAREALQRIADFRSLVKIHCEEGPDGFIVADRNAAVAISDAGEAMAETLALAKVALIEISVPPTPQERSTFASEGVLFRSVPIGRRGLDPTFLRGAWEATFAFPWSEEMMRAHHAGSRPHRFEVGDSLPLEGMRKVERAHELISWWIGRRPGVTAELPEATDLPASGAGGGNGQDSVTGGPPAAPVSDGNDPIGMAKRSAGAPSRVLGGDDLEAVLRGRLGDSTEPALRALVALRERNEEWVPRSILEPQIGIPATSVEQDHGKYGGEGTKRGGHAGRGPLCFKRDYLMAFVANRWRPRSRSRSSPARPQP